MSLSHSKNIGIICLAKAADIQSIGIDLEFEGRKINPKSARFFMQPDEDHSNLLEAWVKKEAAFKAISPLYPDCKLLKQIRFQNNKFYFSLNLPRNDQHVTGECSDALKRSVMPPFNNYYCLPKTFEAKFSSLMVIPFKEGTFFIGDTSTV